jgi:hypothetical protein
MDLQRINGPILKTCAWTGPAFVVGIPREGLCQVGVGRRGVHGSREGCRIIVDTESQVSDLGEDLHRVLAKLVAVLRRGDTSRAFTGA